MTIRLALVRQIHNCHNISRDHLVSDAGLEALLNPVVRIIDNSYPCCEHCSHKHIRMDSTRRTAFCSLRTKERFANDCPFSPAREVERRVAMRGWDRVFHIQIGCDG